MPANLPAKVVLPATVPPKRKDEQMHRLAMDIGKEVVAYIEHAYPEMFKAVAHKSAALSIRNATYNAIIAAGEAFQKGEVDQQIKRHEEHRRTMRKLRKAAGA